MRSGASSVSDDCREPADLRIAGITPFTTVDFPGRLAAVVHLQGCPLACPYCHVPHLQPVGPGKIAWSDVSHLLDARHGLLDGIVFTGGEACGQKALASAVQDCRVRGYATALHTSGLYPQMLARVLPYLDWVGLDWKAPPRDTSRVTGMAGLGQRFTDSLSLVLGSGVAHEIRTTWHPDHLSQEDMIDMAHHLARAGVEEWVIQPYWNPDPSSGGSDLNGKRYPFPAPLLNDLRAIVPGVWVRRGQ